MDAVTDATFDAEVLQAELPVVVDFWAPWCAPCRAAGAILAELAHAADGRVRFVKLDVDENYVTAARYEVLSLPTAILFEKGESRERLVGAWPRSRYEQAWSTWLRP